jgi:hypothetical protein
MYLIDLFWQFGREHFPNQSFSSETDTRHTHVCDLCQSHVSLTGLSTVCTL